MVKDASTFQVGNYAQVFDAFCTGINTQIIGINYATNTLMLADPVPANMSVQTGLRVVSNVYDVVWEWDFLSHRDNSNDGSQYWSWLYEYRVQVWVNKKRGESIEGVIKQIDVEIEDFQSDVLNSIKVP